MKSANNNDSNNDSSKPVFLTKQQREELALQRLQSKKIENDKKLNDIKKAHENFITGNSTIEFLTIL